MVMYAEIIAAGPFSRDLTEHLEYSEIHYKDTKEGAIITQTLFGVVEGTAAGVEFAACLGIADAWNFNQHKIDNEKIDMEALKEFVGRYADYEADFRKLAAFRARGFEFHFVPNF